MRELLTFCLLTVLLGAAALPYQGNLKAEPTAAPPTAKAAATPATTPSASPSSVQTPAAEQPLSPQAAMQASIEKQKNSIRKQAGGGTSNSFFTVEWSQPSQLPQPAQLPPSAPPDGKEADCEPLPAQQQEELVAKAAKKEGVSANLLQAVAEKESGFRPCVTSPRGAQGLMQLMPTTAWELGVKNVFDPEENMLAGAKFLRQLLGRYSGNVRLALSAYNAGMARVDPIQDIPPIAETQNYVRGILATLRQD